MIFKSDYPSCAPFPELTVAQYLTSNPFKIDPKTVIYSTPSGDRTKTYEQYCTDITAVSSGLKHLLGSLLEPGDILSVFSPNIFDYSVLAIGIVGADCVPAPVNPVSSPEELAHALSLVEPKGPKVVFLHPSISATLQAALRLTNFERTPVIISVTDAIHANQLTLSQVMTSGYANPKPLASLRQPSASQIAAVYYSSGTTGKYKGVMLSHRNIIANVYQIKTIQPTSFSTTDRMISFLPMYHIYGTTVCIFTAPVSGTLTILLDAFDFDVFLAAIEKHRIETVPIVPPIAVLLAKDPRVDKYDLSSVKYFTVGAAPTKIDVINQIKKRIPGVSMTQSYGMTETSPGAVLLDIEFEHVQGSVGKLVCDMEARIVGIDDGKDKGIDEEGELLLRGPNIMLGYFRNKEATDETIIDGWLHTGDIARINKDGFFWIVDRLKELIKVRGFQVPPAELEAVLLSHPKVLDCAVTATYNDDKGTELPRAFVVVSPENRNEEVKNEIIEYHASKVAYYKKLEGGLVFLDAIPKNPSGKILRRLLPRETGAERAKL